MEGKKANIWVFCNYKPH